MAVAAKPSSVGRSRTRWRSRSARAFAKLGNLPLPLSETLLWEGTQRLEKILPEKPAVDPFPLPACWKRHEVFGIDGKAIKHVKRLLKPLRGLQAGILGGRASVALNLRTGLAVGMLGDLDGEAGEGLLSEGLLSEMAAAADGKPWVVVLDRLYCNLGFPSRVLDAGGHFLIRYCSNTHFVADPARPAQDKPRCERPANRAGVGTAGQVGGTSCSATFAGSPCIWPAAQ